ncbi:MAG: hypothetical protein ACE5R6_07160 [Candidatus Heimdallarchaeota archaeon]
MAKKELEVVEVPQYDKLIIEVLENETCTLDGDNSLLSTALKGMVKIVNPSKSPIWNTELSLDGDLCEKFLVGLIPDKRVWCHNFERISPPSILEIREEIDTNYQDDKIPKELNLSLPIQRKTGVMFRILLNNTSEMDISNISLHKRIPEDFSEPIQKKISMGLAKFDRKQSLMSWTLQTLAPNSTAELHLYSEIEASQKTPYDAGEIEIQYEIKNYAKTNLIIDLTSTSKKIIEIRKDESEQKHGLWNCSLEFHNKSNLTMYIENLKITDNVGEFHIVKQPKVMVDPLSDWSYNFEIHSMDVPVLKSTITSRVVFELKKSFRGTITKKGTLLPVIAAEIFKSYSPRDVFGLVETPLEVSILLRNIGSSHLNQIKIKDTIPKRFRPPPLFEAKFIAKDIEISPDKSSLIPEDRDPSKVHRLVLEINDLQKITGKIESGGEVLLRYPLIALAPRPGEYEAGYEIFLNGYPLGLEAHYTGLSIIHVRHVRRKLICTKSVIPIEVDEYQIDLEIRNEGEIEIKGITIHDKLPIGFQIIQFEPTFLRPIKSEDEDGSKISWLIDKIRPDDTITITYIAKGEGIIEEYEPEYEVNV